MTFLNLLFKKNNSDLVSSFVSISLTCFMEILKSPEAISMLSAVDAWLLIKFMPQIAGFATNLHISLQLFFKIYFLLFLLSRGIIGSILIENIHNFSRWPIILT